MTIVYVEVVIRTKHIGQYDRCVTMTILLEVCPVNTETHTETIKYILKQFICSPSPAQMIEDKHSIKSLCAMMSLTRNLIPP